MCGFAAAKVALKDSAASLRDVAAVGDLAAAAQHDGERCGGELRQRPTTDHDCFRAVTLPSGFSSFSPAFAPHEPVSSSAVVSFGAAGAASSTDVVALDVLRRLRRARGELRRHAASIVGCGLVPAPTVSPPPPPPQPATTSNNTNGATRLIGRGAAATTCRRPRTSSPVMRPSVCRSSFDQLRARRAADVPVRAVVGEDHPVVFSACSTMRACFGKPEMSTTPSAARAGPSAAATGRPTTTRSAAPG